MLLLPDWLLWHSPTDVELAVEALYSLNPGRSGHSHKNHQGSSGDSKLSGAELLRNVANDFIHAYNPLGARNFPPVMIMQTASSTALDHLADEIEPSGDASIIADSRRFAEKLVSKKLMLANGDSDDSDEEYTGIGADQRDRLPLMMGKSEEMELFRNRTINSSRPAVPRAFSLASMSTTDTGSVLPQPFMIARSTHLSSAFMPHAATGRATRHTRTVSDGSITGVHGSDLVGVPEQKSQNRFSGGSLISRAKEISSKIMRKPIHESQFSGSRTDHEDSAIAHTRDARKGKMASASAISLDKLQHHRLSDMASGRPSISSEFSLQSVDSAEIAQELDQILEQLGSDSFEHSQEDSDSQPFSYAKAKGTSNGIDLTSLYAFRCVHRGKYGTLFVTRSQCIFRRSRILGGRKSSMAMYPLSNVVAIRKSSKRFSKSSGIQLLMSDGKPVSFYGLSRRDDVFGFMLIRCGCQHVF
ncbi:hypothetical protein FBU59_004891 [Linderina macrospora]|uniref:Uncharacterized protein n=1 Tax=Linderina macrospora TaxID=4868 RepID=A0ACC1J4A0_9FUNG|nr:hypothetical protein FBU59_004891 [Linderina macrospora]